MRVLSVTAQGFGPFKDAQTVDFTAFDDFGIFLIGGRTGAGKSTILDAVCFALYGSVPRYEAYSGNAHLRSDHCTADEETSVTLQFESAGETYRIVRNPEYERTKSRGDGVTPQPAAVELSIQTDRGWQCLETKAAEAARRIAEIVGLDRGQFLQVTLLAQNRFQEFLEADSGDRQALLRTLFDTRRFEDYAETLHARARDLGEQRQSLTSDTAHAVEEIAAQLEASPPLAGQNRLLWVRECLKATVSTMSEAQAAEAQAVRDARSAHAALNEVQQLAERQRRRTEALARLRELEGQSEVHEHNRQRLQDATFAAQAEQQMRAADASAAALVEARVEESAARDAAGVSSEARVDVNAAELAHLIGSLDQALAAETRLEALTQADLDADTALTDHDREIAQIDIKRRTLAERGRELDKLEMVARGPAQDLTGAQQQLASLEFAQTALSDATQMETVLDRLRDALALTLMERTEATRHEERLRNSQLHGRAAILAEALTEGQPCPVCGALEHPNPARFGQEVATDEEVESARLRLEQAQSAVDDAAASLSESETRSAELHGAAGRRSAEALAAELYIARGRLQTARTAQDQLESVTVQRAQRERELAELEERERGAAQRRTELAEAAVLARNAAADAQALVARSRDGRESVADRVGELQRRHATLKRLIDGRAELRRAIVGEDTAITALSARLGQGGFAGREEAEAAMLPEPEREALVSAVRAHEHGLTAAKAILGQSEFQNLPGQDTDVSRAELLAAQADGVRDAATERRVRLESAVQRAQQLRDRLETDLA
ncbi:MAG: AAA family ATPase, partial [Solirubrobacteraceae bacterium]